jgi:hypothetical protein
MNKITTMMITTMIISINTEISFSYFHPHQLQHLYILLYGVCNGLARVTHGPIDRETDNIYVYAYTQVYTYIYIYVHIYAYTYT